MVLLFLPEGQGKLGNFDLGDPRFINDLHVHVCLTRTDMDKMAQLHLADHIIMN